MLAGSSVCILSVLLLVVIFFVIGFILIYNRFIQMQNQIEKSWANIDVMLQQRSSELPNLINSVKGYMKYESELLDTITKARSFLEKENDLSKKAAADNLISESIKTVFAVAENYPDLKAVDNFIHLQKRITGLENELSDRREFYNDCVTIYNTRVKSFPDLFVARLIHLSPKKLYKASEEDKKYVKINL